MSTLRPRLIASVTSPVRIAWLARALACDGYHVKAVGASGESVQSQEHYFGPDGEAPQRVGGGVGLDVQQP